MTSSQIHEDVPLLVVDDNPVNLELLLAYLEDAQFKVFIANNGRDALEVAAYAKPQLILLDIMMPEMDGYEACSRLKQNEQTRDIPVIFMSALSETVDKIKGLRLGAVDYITKPFQQDEVLARINTHLELKWMREQLEEQKQVIEKDNQELARQNQELTAFANIMAQDLKQPLIRLAGFTKILLKDFAAPQYQSQLKYMQEIEEARQAMVVTIDNLLLLARINTHAAQMDIVDMAKVLAEVRHRLAYLLEKYDGKLIMPKTSLISVLGYNVWIEKIWETLIVTSLKYSGLAPRLELGADSSKDGFVRFWVQSESLNLGAARLKQLFDDADSLMRDPESLGFAVIQRIVREYGGVIGHEKIAPQGARLYFTLPEVN